MSLAWGNSVSSAFRMRLIKIAGDLAVSPDYLMACMAFESARTFDASTFNAAGSGAVGLIQFMPQTAAALGTTTKKLAAMTPVKQLDYVYAYLKPYKNKLHSLEDVYMAILWPAAVGKPNHYVLFQKSDPKHPKRYIQNAGLDFNRDGVITKREAASRVHDVLADGLKKPNLFEAV